MSKPTVISVFTGAMGLDLGFEAAGFDIKVCVEKDPWAVETIKENRESLPVVSGDIHNITTSEILEKAGLKEGEATVLIGASPCEPFSTAGRRMSIEDKRATTISEFIRLVNEARPRFFVYEQVPGFIRAAKRHISFYDRVKKRPEDLHPDERLGSAFEEIMSEFQSTGYAQTWAPGSPKTSILNAADYGSPQKRRRFILIGSREGTPAAWPEKTHDPPDSPEVASGRLAPWMTLRQALETLDDPTPEYLKFPDSWAKFLPRIPAGGNWRDLPIELHKEALGGAYDYTGENLKGGRTGFLRRLSWDKPSPTVVDRPNTRAGCLCHPEEDRPLSVKEYARIQGFNDDWIFKGSLQARYQLIGQATPIPLSEAVARAIVRHQSESIILQFREPIPVAPGV